LGVLYEESVFHFWSNGTAEKYKDFLQNC